MTVPAGESFRWWFANIRRAENRDGRWCSERERAKSIHFILCIRYPQAVRCGDAAMIERILGWANLTLINNYGVPQATLDAILDWHLQGALYAAEPCRGPKPVGVERF